MREKARLRQRLTYMKSPTIVFFCTLLNCLLFYKSLTLEPDEMCGIQILKPSFLNELAFSILENTTSPPGPFGYFSKWRLSNRHFEKYAEGPEGRSCGKRISKRPGYVSYGWSNTSDWARPHLCTLTGCILTYNIHSPFIRAPNIWAEAECS